MLEKVVIFDGTSLMEDAYRSSFTESMKEAELLYKNAKTDKDIEYALNQKSIAYDTLLKSSNGIHIGAVQGFLNIFLDVLDKQKPFSVVVVWGTAGKTAYYKESKNIKMYNDENIEIDEPLKEQIQTIQKILNRIGVAQYRTSRHKSLDIISGIANKYKDYALPYIVTQDSNSLQLLDISNILIKKAVSNTADKGNDCSSEGFVEYDLETFKKIYGLTPEQYVDCKALVGNSSIGIPGVKNIEKRTALPLMRYFSTLENMYMQLDKVKEQNDREPEDNVLEEYLKTLKDILGIRVNLVNALLEGREDAFLSRDLIRLDRDISIEDKVLDMDISKEILLSEMKKIELASNKALSSKVLKEICFSDIIKDFNSSSDNVLELNDNDNTNLSKSEDSDLKKEACIEQSNFVKTDCKTKENESDSPVIGESWFMKADKNNNTNLNVNSVSRGQTLSVIETMVLTKYKCSSCNEEFIVEGEKLPKFCLNCGAKN